MTTTGIRGQGPGVATAAITTGVRIPLAAQSSGLRIAPRRARPGICAAVDCGERTMNGDLCPDCRVKIEALYRWRHECAARKAASARGGRGRVSVLSWLGPLVFVSCGLAVFLYAEAGFILGCVDKLNSVWGK